VYVGDRDDRSIHVLSLDGKPRRVITSQPGGWRIPKSLCCVGDRLYLTEEHEGHEYDDVEDDEEDDDEEEAAAIHLTGRRVFVLTPEGTTLQAYKTPGPEELVFEWRGMCHFDGKLVLCNSWEQNELIALQGL